jgi:homogentisate 1,2-dioxygenase
VESFKASGIYTKQAHVRIPDGTYEQEIGRKGFFGRVSQLYHENPPTGWTKIEGNLRPRCLPPLFGDKVLSECFTPFLYNADVIISMGEFKNSFVNFFRNADADELFFIHEGNGVIETSFGPLPFLGGDYVVMPRGTTYKIFVGTHSKILKVESAGEFEQVDRNLLGPNALYDQTAIETPQARVGSDNDASEYQLEIKRLGEITTVTYPFNPLDVVGWKGSGYPWKLSIYDICPIMSHRYHIPPSGHTTFMSHNFVVCSFVERPLEDKDEKVLRVPFYHSNIDYDEVLFYHKGDFFSRANIDSGALTFHPQGIDHGPHPKAVNSIDDKTRTDEFAVMIDTRYPLKPTDQFSSHEISEYWKSWM